MLKNQAFLLPMSDQGSQDSENSFNKASAN